MVEYGIYIIIKFIIDYYVDITKRFSQKYFVLLAVWLACAVMGGRRKGRERKMGNVTILDVAKYANVSAATVSNAINETRGVSEELRNKVFQAIEELGYEVDYSAKTAQKYTSMNIGVVVTSIQRIFFPEVLDGIQSMAERYGYNIFFNISHDNIEKERSIVKMLVDSKVDGIIIHTVSGREDENRLSYLQNLRKNGKKIPVVSLERDLTGQNIPSVFVDNCLGGRLAANHLLDTGAEEFACITGPENSEVSNKRTRAFVDVLSGHGYVDTYNNHVYQGDFSPLSGYRLMRRLLLDGLKPQGVFCCNDQMAVGAMNAINEYGLRVPEDIKIIGYDNTFVSSIVTPQLTTINVPKKRMGEEAFCLLLKLMSEVREPEGKEALSPEIRSEKTGSVKIPIDLIVRQSTVKSAQAYAWDLEDW